MKHSVAELLAMAYQYFPRGFRYDDPHHMETPEVLRESGLLFAAENLLSIVPATNSDGVGIYDQSSIAIGYAWDSGQRCLPVREE